MRISLIDEEDVVERIARHLGLWQERCGAFPHRPPGEMTLNRCFDDLFPDYDTNRSWHSSHLKSPGAPKWPLAPLFTALSPPPAAVFDLWVNFCHSALTERHAFRFKPRANAPEG